MGILYSIPAALLLLFAVITAIAAAGGGQIYVHHRFSSQDFVAHNEVGGIIIAVAGTLYAVILGFLTVVAWQHFLEARDVVVLESDADIDAWHTAVGLPPAVCKRVRSDMLSYAKIMIEHEWPSMRHGSFDSTAAAVAMDAIDATGTLVPANMGESNAQILTMEQLGVIHDARQRRVTINASGVSWFEWLVLLIGATCVICFCWLFGLSNPRTQLLMTSTVVTIIVSILVLLFELQYPFRSNVGIGPDAWERAVEHIHQMQSSGQMSMKM
ncbi:MAG: DUF4239 domain-containing protein [Deltaproteobacteria bacterium]|nr:DUF4239 domain-containing protein [Deltaproteobacteria bacterium]